MRTLTTLVLLSFVTACTVDEPKPNPIANNVASNNATTTNNGGTSPNGSTINGQPGDPISLVVRVAPVEWGLFAVDVDSTPDEVFSGAVVVEEPISVTLPAGASRIVVEIDGQASQLATDRALASPAGTFQLGDLGDGGVVFTPDESEFTLSIVDGGAIQLERVQTAVEALPADSPEHASEVGPLFDELLRTYDPAAEDRTAVFELLDALHTSGGTPVVTQRGLLFLAPGVPGDTPELVGSFNGWTQTPGWELRQLVPGLFARYVELDESRHAYKIAYGDSWTKDRANRHIEWDGINTQSVGFFNSVVWPTPTESRLVLWPAVQSPQLGNEREVYVYLPPGYAAGGDHPLLIAHDGNESIVRAQFHDVTDTWSTGQPAAKQPVIAFVALPSQDVRMAEYTFASDGSRGDDYGDFLADTLHPMLIESFAIADGRQNSGLIGASLGGLISFYVLSQHSDVFGYAAGMSSSFFWADDAMLDIISQNGCFDADFYLDSGSPNDNFVVTQQMRDLLNTQGCRYRYVLDEGGTHEWWKWNERLPGVLDHFAGVTR